MLVCWGIKILKHIWDVLSWSLAPWRPRALRFPMKLRVLFEPMRKVRVLSWSGMLLHIDM
ncbi:hypothetical protein RchiOBHm_Chr5g0052091 [Rosa chinensis]|uniref:Uncharacterized protein n=1 Tax=Rosa chinensis TaxID=74649 RepID=A0A2P6QFJ3_ROSCH|nr:hypothetical protein RchiOBHm_Chr5g0052091 [Rosa chinensis]